MERHSHQSSLWSGGLIGVSIVMLQSFLSIRPLDTDAFISVFAFALAIPILTCNILINMRRGVGARTPIREILFYTSGMLASLIGIAFALLHICWIAFAIFLASAFIAAFVYFTSVSEHK